MRAIQAPMGILVAVAVVLAACAKDAQTDEQIGTKTAGGEVSTSMSGDAADKKGMALVRVVNAVPALKGLTVRSDDTHSLPSVDYKKVSAYQPIDNHWVKFEVGDQPTGSFAPMETNRELLTDGYRYTMVVMPSNDGNGYTSRIVRDELSDDQTKVYLRVIHAAPDLDEINVVAKGGETLFDGINFKSEAGFKEVAPWSGTLEFRTEDDKRLVGTLPNVALRAGTSYTVVVTRDKGGKLAPIWFEDQPMAGR